MCDLGHFYEAVILHNPKEKKRLNEFKWKKLMQLYPICMFVCILYIYPSVLCYDEFYVLWIDEIILFLFCIIQLKYVIGDYPHYVKPYTTLYKILPLPKKLPNRRQKKEEEQINKSQIGLLSCMLKLVHALVSAV